MQDTIKLILERLTGEKSKINSTEEPFDNIFNTSGGICYNQLNEMLLFYGYDRITNESFFKFLLMLDLKPKDSIKTIAQFADIVEEFNKVSLLLFGNFKYAYKTLANNEEQLKRSIELIKNKNIDCYHNRASLLMDIEPIKSVDTVYLGEYIRKEISDMHEKNPDDPFWSAEKAKMDSITPKGIKNNDIYLISDNMDVYIATSMRERHEYVIINDFINDVFSRPEIEELNLRFFDPTQAYCENRVDKGLTEALMLKRADCTIYLAQETDTLGKDSELATTLAQGKPVIVYVPKGEKSDVDKLIEISRNMYREKTIKEIIFHLLSIFEPKLIWKDDEIELRKALDSDVVDEDMLYERLCSIVKEKYDKRANGLKEKHPLGIQIDLSKGVANGVLVARTTEQCAALLRGIILNNLDYHLEPAKPEIDKNFVYLKDNITNSVFRVMTNSPLLTNTFWNFYSNQEA